MQYAVLVESSKKHTKEGVPITDYCGKWRSRNYEEWEFELDDTKIRWSTNVPFEWQEISKWEARNNTNPYTINDYPEGFMVIEPDGGHWGNPFFLHTDGQSILYGAEVFDKVHEPQKLRRSKNLKEEGGSAD